MAKFADIYYKIDPWKIIEEGFDEERNMVSESIFSIGNEYMGVRGYFEEGSTCEKLLGSYFNGVYEYSTDVNRSGYKGIIDHTHFMVNSVDWLYTRILIDGERLDLKVSQYEKFSRILDLKAGTLSREFIWDTKSGKRVKVKFLRFLNMNKSQEGFQRITFEPINFSGNIEVIMALDFSIIHESKGKCFWNVIKKEASDKRAAIIGQTLTSNQKVFSGFTFKSDSIIGKSVYEDEKTIGYNLNISLKQGEISSVDKLVSNIVLKDSSMDNEELWNTGINSVREQEGKNIDYALEESKAYWNNIWNRFDIQIEGDEKNQQGIRFCIFQMTQTYSGQNPTNNIGAKGLTGEAYNGHAFWDTETCCFPFYLFNNLKAAKNLLEFRYSKLGEAKKRAKMLDCAGACYPIATLNGEEACDLWQHASLQFQPSTGVAYAIWHYVHLSDDKEFLFNHGAEMLVEISRFLKTRGAWGGLNNKFGIYAVMGPDEFHMMVNNNSYTNYMAKKTFDYTLEVLAEMEEKSLDLYNKLRKKIGFTEEELKDIKNCSDNMNILYNEKTKIFEQHEGYFELPHIDVNSIPVEEFPLYNNWSYDRIYRSDMIKQADVLMFLFLYNQEFSLESKRANYEYYEPRTIHESSLSPSIHSILASELQKHEEAFKFFGFATRMDLDNYNRNTKEGIHTTSLAGAWLNIVYGFGGMRSDGKVLKFNPSIPKAWNSYSFRVVYKSAVLSVKACKEELTIKVLNDKSVEIEVYDEKYSIDSEGITLRIPEGWRA
ncbi:glycoside hydrolase family 65 protein [Clostridium paridis]|uniref:Family 65 glycosyl hydrolase n=1 Tax=Clostridium paridis TaxID=2803863 RepID=A0A937FGW4_9CLOT|nr:glycosyl hydrolase family 65 protein [Clostridium paridis]MBL4933154.1 family 65 glycosyl hydrolase [Clostridium paridis]